MTAKTNKYYAVFDNEGQFKIWSDPHPNKKSALAQGEMRVLDTFGSRNPKYLKRVNGLFAIDEHEARYMKVIS